MRLRDGEQPIRWCSVEALEESRYSTASDVWAFGVTVWEIMSNGALPYEDLVCLNGNLALVAEHVKGGRILQPPLNCPVDVYADLMVPCWDPNPSARPVFVELGNTAQALGGVMSDRRHAHSNTDVVPQQAHDNLTDTDLYGPAFWESDEGLELRGVSIHHLIVTLHPLTIEETRVPYDDNGTTVQPPPPDDVTIKDAVLAVVKPRCKDLTCPRDGQRGCAYVDSLMDGASAGPPSRSCRTRGHTVSALSLKR